MPTNNIKNRLDKLEQKLNKTEVLNAETRTAIIIALSKEEYLENNNDPEDKALIIKWQNKLGKRKFREEFKPRNIKPIPQEVIDARFKK